ncbi:MAG TPA: hypothetical protein VFU50_09485 [Terriglobales bacterium]|nr:hypothetical protein [Terriglobales bacterium]
MVFGAVSSAARLRTEHSSVLSRITTENQDFSNMPQDSSISELLLRCYYAVIAISFAAPKSITEKADSRNCFDSRGLRAFIVVRIHGF